jgi:hypothetical protein
MPAVLFEFSLRRQPAFAFAFAFAIRKAKAKALSGGYLIPGFW